MTKKLVKVAKKKAAKKKTSTVKIVKSEKSHINPLRQAAIASAARRTVK